MAPPQDAPAQRRAPEPATARVGTPARVLALQRTVGNAAVGRLMRFQKPPTPSLESIQAEYLQQRTLRDEYVKAGKKGPVTYDPSKRNKDNYYGGFDVEYDPEKQVLTIRLKAVADFQAGIILKDGRAVANEPSAETQSEVDNINGLPAAGRPSAIEDYQWETKTVGDKSAFMTDFKRVVEDAWDGKHAFHCTKTYWQDLGAHVDIDVDMVEMDAAHQPGSPYHMKALVYKVPDYHGGGQANVNRAVTGGTKKKDAGAFSNVMTMSSLKAQERKDELLKRRLTFAGQATTVTAAQKTRLKALAKDMPDGEAGTTAPVADVTVSVQGKDAEQRAKRFKAVSAVLTGNGMSANRVKFADGGEGGLTELTIGNGIKQISAAHESGHMFGLDDEYIAEGAYAAGKKTEHTDFVGDTTGVTGTMHATSDSIMSNGRVVRQQHYATFLDALRVVSGIEQWAFGEPEEVHMHLPIEYAPVDDEMLRQQQGEPW